MEIIHLSCLTGLTCIIKWVSWTIWPLLPSRVGFFPPCLASQAGSRFNHSTDRQRASEKEVLKKKPSSCCPTVTLLDSMWLTHLKDNTGVLTPKRWSHRQVNVPGGTCWMAWRRKGGAPPHVYSVLRPDEQRAKQMGKKAAYVPDIHLSPAHEVSWSIRGAEPKP